MFEVSSVRRVYLFVSEGDIAAVTAGLLSFAPFTFMSEEEPDASSQWDQSAGERWRERADTYADLERRAADLLETLQVSTLATPPAEEVDPRRDAQDMIAPLKSIEREVQEWQTKRDDLEDRRERLNLIIEGVQAFAPLDVDLKQVRNTRFLYLQVGTVPRESLTALHLAQTTHSFVILPVQTNENRALVVAVSARDDAAILDEILASASVDLLSIPKDLDGPADAVRDTLLDRRDALDEQLTAWDEKRRELAEQWGDRLRQLWRRAHRNRTITEQILEYPRHEDTYLIVGQVPADATDAVEETVQHATDTSFALITRSGTAAAESVASSLLDRLRRSLSPTGRRSTTSRVT